MLYKNKKLTLTEKFFLLLTSKCQMFEIVTGSGGINLGYVLFFPEGSIHFFSKIPIESNVKIRKIRKKFKKYGVNSSLEKQIKDLVSVHNRTFKSNIVFISTKTDSKNFSREVLTEILMEKILRIKLHTHR